MREISALSNVAAASGVHVSPKSLEYKDRKSTRLNSSHTVISYAVFCLKKKNLPTLISETGEAEIDGVTSRKLSDRGIASVIENAWSAEVRSPSNMMQEVASQLSGAGST